MIEIQPKTKSIHDRLDMRELFQKVADKKESIDKLVGTFINRCGYTDISPVGQVIAAWGRTLHLRRVITTTEWPINKTELKQYFKDRLSIYLKDPIINIRILNYKVSILGEVKAPGQYSTNSERITLLELISNAGDLTFYGKRDNILIIRDYMVAVQ